MTAARFPRMIGYITALALGYTVLDYAVLNRSPVQSLSGTVRFEGELMARGTILFVSLDEEKPGAFGGYISNGRYEVPLEFGLPPALYHVSFSSVGVDDVQKKMNEYDDEDLPTEAQYRETLPPKFNSQSMLRLDLSSGHVLEADFDLK